MMITIDTGLVRRLSFPNAQAAAQAIASTPELKELRDEILLRCVLSDKPPVQFTKQFCETEYQRLQP